ncbi:hypothetical protein AB0C74_38820 [Spirillospora sp. NPDC048832]
MTTPNYSELSLDQLREESVRLGRELTKLTVLLTMHLGSAMQRRFPGPLEQAVEETAQAMRLPPERLWAYLRNDAVRNPRAGGSISLTETAEAILLVCGQQQDSSEYFQTTAFQTMAFARRAEEVAVQRGRIFELRNTLERREREQREREREATIREAGLREVERQLQHNAGKRMRVWREPPTVVPDTPGANHQPDPMAATSVGEYVESLRRLHVWAGEVSLRELARRSPESIAHSTFGAMLNTPSRLPAQRTVQLFVRALGCDEHEVQRWVTAWRDLRFKRQACHRADATVTQFRRPASSQ